MTGAGGKLLPVPRAAFPVLSDDEKRASLAETLAAAPDLSDISVFAYGSLMWRPAFPTTATVRATLAGHRRSFCFWTVLARGTPERPGLGLGLVEVEQGQCSGMVQKLPQAGRARDEALWALWQREMYSGVYRPRWVEVETDDGGRAPSLAFVADPGHPQYVEPLDPDVMADIMVAAHGKYGPCHEYLAMMVDKLGEHGVREAELDDLLARVTVRLAGRLS